MTDTKVKLKIYLCGPTVYDQVHVGNMRSVVLFDLITRANSEIGVDVEYLQNITDIDDKIRERAKEEGVDERTLARRFTVDYEEILKSFNVKRPTYLVRVSEKIEQIKAYIDQLIEAGSAYIVESGIYFDVSSIKGYGSLANRPLDKLISNHTKVLGQRFNRFLAEFDDKRSEYDFALWKFKEGGDVFEFKDRKGRPGWHTECAALVDVYFRGSCDIHGGGMDLLFPHHENENAQNFSLYGFPITKSWIHVGHLQMRGQKMSKSLGNVWYARDFLRDYAPDVYRALILLTRFQSPLNLTEELLKQAVSFVKRFKLVHNFYWLNQSSVVDNVLASREIARRNELLLLVTKLQFSRLTTELNLLLSEIESGKVCAAIVSSLFKALGFQFPDNLPTIEDKELFRHWKEALDKRDFCRSDTLREELKKRELI